MITENESIKLIFGLKIRSLRQQLNLSYHQLSDNTKLAVSYLHDIENGKKYPKADKIMLLAKALNVEYDYLVSLNGGKKLQPIIDILNSEFINVVPWELFGLSPTLLLDLFSNAPDKITAFISTVLKIFRSYQMTKESFYNTALRSYQDLNDNYFGEIEQAANQFRLGNFNEEEYITHEKLINFLENILQVKIDRKKIANNKALQNIRSVYNPSKNILFLNKGITQEQETFVFAREIAFKMLNIHNRPYETVARHISDFELLLNNFKASYFAAALLLPEDKIAEDLSLILQQKVFNGNDWLQLTDKYSVTPEMLWQRFTNLLPKHFGISQLFFLRVYGDVKADEYVITKELHLTTLHNPYANAVSEHYCRRWAVIDGIKQAATLQSKKSKNTTICTAQISHYWQTQSRYLCITVSKPLPKSPGKYVAITIGIMLDAKLQNSVNFLNDFTIPTKTVHTTCEQCGILDCKERVAEPLMLQKKEEELALLTALNELKNS